MIKKSQWTYRELLIFSIPSILSSLVEPLASVVDTSLVGHLNTFHLAALGIGTTLFNSFTWGFNFLVHTTTQAVSESIGRENKLEINQKIRVSILFTGVVGIIAAIILYIFKLPLYKLAGANEFLINPVNEYFTIRLIGHPMALFYLTFLSILRGFGRVKLTFVLVLITTSLNILISWSLLYQFNLGISGVALGTIASSVIGSILSLIFVCKEKYVEVFKYIPLNLSDIKIFGKNSFAFFSRSASLTCAFFLTTKFASQLGVKTLAAHQIVLQFWLMMAYLIDGLAITANILIANFKGENNTKKMVRVTKDLLSIGTLLAAFVTLCFFFFPKVLWGFFTEDITLYPIISSVWVFVIIFQIPNAWAFILDGVLFGLAEFQYIKNHMMIGVFLICIPIMLLGVRLKSLLIIWLGHGVLNVYRNISYYLRVKKYL